MSRASRVLPSLVTIALMGVAPAALAQQSRPPPDPQQSRPPPDPQARRDSASDAVRQVERNTRAEVLSVERVQYDGRDMHRVKVVDDHGRVRVYMQDSSRGNDQRPTNSRSNDDDN